MLAFDLSDLSGLVIAAEEGDSARISQLKAGQHADRFYTVVSTVYKVPEECVIDIGTLPSHPKDLEHVIELPVHIPTDCDRGAQRKYIRFID